MFSLKGAGTFFNLDYLILNIGAVLIISIIYLFIFMSNGDKMILKATGANETSRKQYPYLFHKTEELAIAAGINPAPKCYVIQDTALNAYATGFSQKKSYIVVTSGLMEKLNREEIEGVLAHEMSHIKNKDIKIMLLAAGLIGATVLFADLIFRIFIFGGHGEKRDGKLMAIAFGIWLVLIILTPIVGQMIKMAISRNREYLADSTGAKLTRYPAGLISALEKISADPDPLVDKANKSTAHLFISSPFRKKKNKKIGFIQKLFATHPPIKERIKRLKMGS